ncbi:hypothetical protein CD201_04795 [Hafnia alvei]|nr:hypothetical protein CD201_04795 [Hafnia alvei]
MRIASQSSAETEVVHGPLVAIGAHCHTVAPGAYGHTITVNVAGNAENTVKNIAYNYLVRLV